MENASPKWIQNVTSPLIVLMDLMKLVVVNDSWILSFDYCVVVNVKSCLSGNKKHHFTILSLAKPFLLSLWDSSCDGESCSGRWGCPTRGATMAGQSEAPRTPHVWSLYHQRALAGQCSTLLRKVGSEDHSQTWLFEAWFFSGKSSINLPMQWKWPQTVEGLGGSQTCEWGGVWVQNHQHQISGCVFALRLYDHQQWCGGTGAGDPSHIQLVHPASLSALIVSRVRPWTELRGVRVGGAAPV